MPTATNTRFAVAVHVLTYLAGTDPTRAVSSDELARSVNVNPVHIRRVLGPLRRAGLVHSRSGQHGGWIIGRPAESIRLDEIWSVVRDERRAISLHDPNPSCPVGRGISTALAEIDGEVSELVRKDLARRTVHDLLGHVHAARAR